MSELSSFEQLMLWIVIAVAFVALAYAYWLWRDTIKRDKGSKEMQVVWLAIKTGANAYLQKQLRTMVPVLALLTIVLFFSVYVVKPSHQALELFNNNEQQAQLWMGIGRAFAFVLGATFSIIVGQLGMRVAVEGNIRVAAEAVKENYNGALTVAYRAGTFTGMLTDGLGLLGGTAIFMIFGKAAPDALVGFGFVVTLLALFMLNGGGI
jgi:K(+)-stimulated pyrophosphate-energized sodium pump